VQILPVHHHQVCAEQALDRLTQWPRRQHCAIAEAARTVHHDDRKVAAKRQVLQAVIGDDEVTSAISQQPGSSSPPRADRNGTDSAPRQQQRLIAHQLRIVIHAHHPRPALSAAVAAQHDAGLAAAGAQLLGQPQHQWSLARTAGGEIADHDDRYAGVSACQQTGAIHAAAQTGNKSEQGAKWPQRRVRPGRVPAAFHPAAQSTLLRH
jgi:hypothetical protein